MRKISLNGQWELYDVETGEKYSAQVPGDINYDMYVNKDMPPMYVDENYKLYRFAEKDFTYKKSFELSKEDVSYDHIYLVFQGIDTYAEIYVNDNLIGKTDNAFIGYKFDVKDYAKEGINTLIVKMSATMRYYHAANVDGYSALFTQKRILLRRPQCHYGWDWAPELVGYGIYQDVDIVLQSDMRIENIYYLTENNGNLRIFANLENDKGYREFTAEDTLSYELFYHDEKIVSVKKTVEEIKNFINVKVPDVKHWWANGYGEQHLYKLKVSLFRKEEMLDQKQTNVGFRTVRVLEEPYSEDITTFAFEVNGVKIFGKGSNWVPLDACTGVITDEKYDKAVLLAKDANMNMLRVWGGGLYEKDVFYEACDKYGILVWQDCMISCAEIPDDIEEHRRAVMEEWKYNVLRLRNHPSLLCWTGGNERKKWDGNRKCRGDDLVNVYLRGIVGAYDAKTPYFDQSPHGYNSKDNDLKSGDCHKSAFDIITTENIFDYRKLLATFHTNFNSECTSLGPTVEKSYRKMFTAENQWPRTEMWTYRHSRNPYAKVDIPFIDKIFRYGEHVYGKMKSLSDFCKKGMAVHAKFFGSEIDYHRSGERNAGVMNWMYSDKEQSVALMDIGQPKITWVLVDGKGEKKDYEHFLPPFITVVDRLNKRIRNLKYRYMVGQQSLFPQEVWRYDDWVLREVINNCIAHQDYRSGGNVRITEYEDKIEFCNFGYFIPETIESVVLHDFIPPTNRNQCLVSAMCEVNMIDSITSGIQRIYKIQRDKGFPLPTYCFTNGQVNVTIEGKILNENYTRLLFLNSNLDINLVFLLDKVQKKQDITKEEASMLRKRKLIEGRYPQIYVAAEIAEQVDQKQDYIKNRAFDDEYYKRLITEYLKKYKQATLDDIFRLLNCKLSDVLDVSQKKRKVRYLLQCLRNENKIQVVGKTRSAIWTIV